MGKIAESAEKTQCEESCRKEKKKRKGAWERSKEGQREKEECLRELYVGAWVMKS